MNWLMTEMQRRSLFRRVGIQLLMLLLFLYFSYSGASELGLVSGLPRKFEGHVWLARVMGTLEVFGGLALLNPDGALGGALFLILVMGSAFGFNLAKGNVHAALESLFLMVICVAIAHWRRPQTVERS